MGTAKKCDSAPLQVGQFESSDELLDKWLTNIYFEAGGGGNGGESYALAWYFAALKTATDSMEKSVGRKAFCLPSVTTLYTRAFL